MLKNLTIRLALVLSIFSTFVFLSSLLLTNSSSALGENWLSGWVNRVEITIDHTKIDANLTDFPIMVHLSANSGINGNDVSAVFDELTSDANRKKIAVTTSNGVTQCYVEISYWSDANEQAFLWVKVPNISSTTDTVLYLYYDHTHVNNTNYVGDTGSTAAQEVWDANFVAVWHLTESGNGTAGEYKDSTANGHNGTGGNGNASRAPTRVINELGLPVQSFAGDGVARSSFIQVPDANDLSIPVPGGFTVEGSIWTYKPGDDWGWNYAQWIGKNFDHVKEWAMTVYNSTAYGGSEPRFGWTCWYVCDPEGSTSPGSDFRGAMGLNTWVHVAGVTTCTDSHTGTLHTYRSGVKNGTSGNWNETGGITYTPGPRYVIIGGYDVGNNARWFPGRISEVRISNVSRSVAWLKASSYTQDDQLLTFTTVVVNNNPPALISIGNKTVNEGELLSFKISAIDPDGDDLNYFTWNLPDGANFDPQTQNFSWTPRYDQAGVYTARFEVSDGKSTDSEEISITIIQLHPDWDVNGDSTADVLDIILVSQHWNEMGLTGWILEDTNEDGLINVLDIILIGQNYTL